MQERRLPCSGAGGAQTCSADHVGRAQSQHNLSTISALSQQTMSGGCYLSAISADHAGRVLSQRYLSGPCGEGASCYLSGPCGEGALR